MREVKRRLPQYDYIYLGDNARAPYGNRSFDMVYRFTLQSVEALFEQGCPLVILACNTASAKALRTIQQRILPERYPGRRVLGVIRPTVEQLGVISRSRHVGVLGTRGTIASESYVIETNKLYPDIIVRGKACPLWVPLVENGEADAPGADYFVNKYLDELFTLDPEIDTLVLGCTHYPLLIDKIAQFTPAGVQIIEQGSIVAASLDDYLVRHPEINSLCSRGGHITYLTTDDADGFSLMASRFMNEPVKASPITL